LELKQTSFGWKHYFGQQTSFDWNKQKSSVGNITLAKQMSFGWKHHFGLSRRHLVGNITLASRCHLVGNITLANRCHLVANINHFG
jgi:hypothetical protein